MWEQQRRMTSCLSRRIGRPCGWPTREASSRSRSPPSVAASSLFLSLLLPVLPCRSHSKSRARQRVRARALSLSAEKEWTSTRAHIQTCSDAQLRLCFAHTAHTLKSRRRKRKQVDSSWSSLCSSAPRPMLPSPPPRESDFVTDLEISL
jgi:hypothetical protein